MQLLAQWINEDTFHLTCVEVRCFHYIEIKLGEPIVMEDILAWYNTHRYVSHSGGNLSWPNSTTQSIWH